MIRRPPRSTRTDALFPYTTLFRSSLALIDVWLQGSRLDGLGLVEAIKAFDPTLPIIVISGHGGLDTAVAAIRRGAFAFIEKPFEASRLLHLVARATASERVKFEYEDRKSTRLNSSHK